MYRTIGVAAVLALGLGLAGCLYQRPDPLATARWLAQWGCPPTTVRADTVHIPRVGMTACEVLEKTGAPEKIDRIQTAAGFSADWFYQEYGGGPYGDLPTATHLVVLAQQGRDWRVTAVNW